MRRLLTWITNQLVDPALDAKLSADDVDINARHPFGGTEGAQRRHSVDATHRKANTP